MPLLDSAELSRRRELRWQGKPAGGNSPRNPPPPPLNGAEAGGAPRAPPRESCTLSSAPWPQPAGLHGTSRKVAGGRRMGPSGSGSASLSLGPLRARPSGRLLSRRSAQQGKRARRRCASTALRSIAPSTSTRSITRCAAPVPRGAGVTSGAHDIPLADEPHANPNSCVPGASSTRTGLSRARTTSMAPSVVSTVSRGENRTASMLSTGAWPSSSAGPRTSQTRCT